MEVDIEYPDELHNFQTPENLEISHYMLSNYCNNIANEYDIKMCGVNKLFPNLGNKNKYVLQ